MNKNTVKGLLLLFFLFGFAVAVWISPLSLVIGVPLIIRIAARRHESKIISLTWLWLGILICIVIPSVAALLPADWELQSIDKVYKQYFSSSAIYSNADIPGTFTAIVQFWEISDYLRYFLIPLVLWGLAMTWCGSIVLLIAGNDPAAKLRRRAAGVKEATKYDFSPVWKALEQKIPVVPLGMHMHGKGTREKDLISIPHRMLNQNTCVVGTTGSGKTNTLFHFLDNALVWGKAIVFVDGKGDPATVKKFANHCRIAQRELTVVTIDGEARYNPFATGSVSELADKIIEMSEWSEEHYRLSAQRFVQLLIKFLKLYEIEITLANIVRFCNVKVVQRYHEQQSIKPGQRRTEKPKREEVNEITLDDNEEEEELQPSANETAPKFTEGADILQRMKSVDPKAIDGLQNRLAILAEGDSEAVFAGGGTPLVLSDAIESGAAVMFSLDSNRYPAQSRDLGRLIINDLKSSISKHMKTGCAPVTVIFDEFNVFASDPIVDAINKCRSAGFETLLSFQSLADIDKLESGEALRRQILANCNTLIVQRQRDAKDAEELSAIFGTRPILNQTVQMDGSLATGMQSLSLAHEYVVHPDDIKRLNTGEAWLNVAGFGAAKVKIAPNHYEGD